jgi:tetratricopeptide (TPR) repeat protein
MNKQKFSNSNELKNISSMIESYDKFVKKNDYINALLIAKELVIIRGQIEDWMAQAKCESLLGYFRDAIKSYSQIVHIDDKNSVAWTKLGGLLSIIAMYDEALNCLGRALILVPDSLEVHINIATVLTNIGRHEESLEILDRIIQTKPVFAIVWLNRGLVLKNLGRYDEALLSYEQVLLIEPNHEKALLNKGLVLSSLKRSKEALTSYNLALELNSSNSLSWLGRGLALTSTCNYQEALSSFNKSIEHDDSNSDAWLARGVTLCKLEYYSEALTSFDKSIKIGNKSCDVLIYRAVALLALRNFKDGSRALNLALESLSSVDKFDRQITVKIICNLFYSLNDKSEWRYPIQTLINIYDKHSISYQLNYGLTASISKLVSSVFSVAKVKDWRDIWLEIVINHPELQIPLNMLNTAVDYRETKGSPLIYLGLSKKEVNLFKSLLGVEKSPNPLNESKLLFNAGLIALSGYKFLGRGFVCFFGEKSKYFPRKENMPDELLVFIDEYLPDQEFIVIPPNHESTILLEFDEIGIRHLQQLLITAEQ